MFRWLNCLAVAAVLLCTVHVPSADAQSIITNGGFEDGLAGWTVTAVRAGAVLPDSYAHSGDGSALLVAPTQTPSWAAISQSVRVSRGGRYCLSAWLQPVADGAGFGVAVDGREERLLELLAHGPAGAWGWQRACFVAPRWRVRVTITASKGVLAGGGYVDDVILEPVAQ